jgi:hypothetical protein
VTHTQHVSHDNELLEFLPIVYFNIIYMYIHVEVSLNSGSPCIFYSKPSSPFQETPKGGDDTLMPSLVDQHVPRWVPKPKLFVCL